MVSVLTSESLMCTDLIGRDTDCLRDQRCSSEAATEFPWELRDTVDPDLKEGMGTVVDLCYARENLLCLLEILFDAKNEVWL